MLSKTDLNLSMSEPSDRSPPILKMRREMLGGAWSGS